MSGVHGLGQMPLCMVVGSMVHPWCKAVLDHLGTGSLGHSMLHSRAVSCSYPEWQPRAKGFIFHVVKAGK